MMSRLEGVSIDELNELLDEVSGKKETQRLMVAILYKQGPSVPMIAEWFDLQAGTIYRWFDRLESEPLANAVRDRPKPGRPPKLSEEQRETFGEAIQDPPTEHGFDAQTWTPKVARNYLREEFGVEYTLRHTRRILYDSDIP